MCGGHGNAPKASAVFIVQRLLSSGSAFLVALLLGACNEEVGPDGGETGTVLVTADESQEELIFIGADSKEILGRLRTTERIQGVALSGESQVLYVGVGTGVQQHSLLAVDPSNRRVVWRRALPRTGPAMHDTVVLSASSMAVTEDDAGIYSWFSQADTIPGLSRFNLNTFDIEAFNGPLSVAAGGIVRLAVNGQNLIALIASRDTRPPRRAESIYLLNALSLAVTDSVTPESLGVASGENLFQVMPGGSHNSLYVLTPTAIIHYNFTDRRILSRVSHTAQGSITKTPSGMLLLTDGGTWPDWPGSGLIGLYSTDLQFIGTIDISTPLGGVPNTPSASRSTMAASVPEFPNLVFVRVGSDQTGPLYPAQPARVLVIDLTERRVVHAIDLGGFGASFLVGALSER